MSQKKEDGTHVHKSSKQWQVTAEGIKIEMFEKGGEKKWEKKSDCELMQKPQNYF